MPQNSFGSIQPIKERCDVVVVGGGPGGSAAATYLAKAGLNVVLIEKERHPRFHVGESLLPHSLPILEELGVLDKIHEIGVWKPGAEFISEDGTRQSVFDFGCALTNGPDHAYQVPRDEFDRILFECARDAQVRTYEETNASIVSCEDSGAIVSARAPNNKQYHFYSDFLIDASGRSTISARTHERLPLERHSSSAAIFGHFVGVPRENGPNGGNIRIHLTHPGWMWQIPLPNGTTSIGLVVPGGILASRTGSIEKFFQTRVARCPVMRRSLANAELKRPLSTTGNFSYRTKRSYSPGLIRVGDAYGFIDPIFSSGIHLALESARDAARAVLKINERPTRRAKILRDYDLSVQRRVAQISWFIFKIDDPAFREMLLNPKSTFGIERAIISLLAGDFRPDLRISLRVLLFKILRIIIHLLEIKPKREGAYAR